MKRRVLFLDVDGVLHRAQEPGEVSIATAGLEELRAARPDLFGWVPHLARTLAGHPCDIVVHSSWRRYAPDAVLRDCLGGLGERFVGSSPRELTRELSVLRTAEIFGLGPTDYLVLDDHAPAFGSLKDRLVVCDPARGVSDPTVAAEVLAWLRGER
jgi:hypothetical protein